MNTQELDQLKAQITSLKARLFDLTETYSTSEATIKQLQTFIVSIMEALDLEVQGNINPQDVIDEINRIKAFSDAVVEADEVQEEELIHG